ncbi:cytochrome c biogenesis protein ResB [Nocardioides cavernaquae]|uniref:Cytochrome c biogenesis protein ResB n=1 Tax=Nocardioides cavernaquae TaxID=2321396 RepID=A0A3A5HDP9_9ACTN|nr:cytochrome c biogenesis protein ResB [Nocardioides cavernaquae]RJS46120.1 cytochrome c biogenesis protein ResB [Nocardioides cavernaquae]
MADNSPGNNPGNNSGNTTGSGKEARPLPSELKPRELLRWTWRQLTSMRTALILLFLLALAAVPGSVIPQTSVDAYAVTQWQEDHPKLAPVYEKLGMFSVFESAWFSAIYLLLAVSLVGCILPRTRVYFNALRAAPPAAPRNLQRLPASAAAEVQASTDEIRDRAIRHLRRRRYRVRSEQLRGVDHTAPYSFEISAERGYLREAGNLVFHIAVLVVLAGVALGSVWGYKGGAIVVKGDSFTNTPTLYDDFAAGSLTNADALDGFGFTVDDFDIEWLIKGPRAGMARKFVADLTWWDDKGEGDSYPLRVNHPLTIGGTSVFLIGHGYAPVVTVKDGEGNVAYSGPTPFLPENQQTFQSFGVIKVPDAKPRQIGLEGLFLPTYNEDPMQFGSMFGDDKNPYLTMQAYAGDLGMNDGGSQSVYALEKDGLSLLEKPDGSMFRVDLRVGETVQLPGANGSVTFEGVEPWVRVQVSKRPGTPFALGGAILALLGLLGSLFIRPRRLWVRAVAGPSGETLVEVAGLDRSAGGDLTGEIEAIMTLLSGSPAVGVPEEKQ